MLLVIHSNASYMCLICFSLAGIKSLIRVFLWFYKFPIIGQSLWPHVFQTVSAFSTNFAKLKVFSMYSILVQFMGWGQLQKSFFSQLSGGNELGKIRGKETALMWQWSEKRVIEFGSKRDVLTWESTSIYKNYQLSLSY